MITSFSSKKLYSTLIIFFMIGILGIGSNIYYNRLYAKTDSNLITTPEINNLNKKKEIIWPTQSKSYILSNGFILFDTNIPLSIPFDYNSDDSITKFVSAKIPFNNTQYVPTNLVPLRSDFLVVSNNSMQLHKEALEQLDKLAKEFYTVFNKKIVIVSAYRSYNYQKNLANNCSPTLCARAGYSEHQLWLAIDIFAATSAGSFLSKVDFKSYYERLMSNAHRYGRHNSYQKGVTIDTYQPEPRHRRYLWKELATILYDKQITFSERYTIQTSLKQ